MKWPLLVSNGLRKGLEGGTGPEKGSSSASQGPGKGQSLIGLVMVEQNDGGTQASIDLFSSL